MVLNTGGRGLHLQGPPKVWKMTLTAFGHMKGRDSTILASMAADIAHHQHPRFLPLPRVRSFLSLPSLLFHPFPAFGRAGASPHPPVHGGVVPVPRRQHRRPAAGHHQGPITSFLSQGFRQAPERGRISTPVVRDCIWVLGCGMVGRFICPRRVGCNQSWE